MEKYFSVESQRYLLISHKQKSPQLKMSPWLTHNDITTGCRVRYFVNTAPGVRQQDILTIAEGILHPAGYWCHLGVILKHSEKHSFSFLEHEGQFVDKTQVFHYIQSEVVSPVVEYKGSGSLICWNAVSPMSHNAQLAQYCQPWEKNWPIKNWGKEIWDRENGIEKMTTENDQNYFFNKCFTWMKFSPAGCIKSIQKSIYTNLGSFFFPLSKGLFHFWPYTKQILSL